MPATLTILGALLIGTMLGAGWCEGSAQTTFRAGVDLVTFGVTVVDRKGNLVTDLTATDFEVLEDGQPQAITYFTRGLAEGETGPTHLGLMLDTSASMDADLKLARSAAVKFLNLLPEAEDITLVDFDTEVRVTRYPQRDFARLVERIRMRKAEGWTALYDALGVYLDGADGRSGRTVLVMYTDGADSRSRLSFTEVMNMLRASPVTVYAVGLVEHAGSARNESRMRMQQMVEATGGQVFFPSQLKDLDASYQKVLAEIKAQYQLGYASSNPAQDGKWRKVEIKIKRPDVKLRTRKGYFATYKPR
ncbi:MAG TPA: VWA domain-containing protein [Vicinamibacterales bacterium]|nr:VWA domain-containing protein [Vicinamibacterales bacterium]